MAGYSYNYHESSQTYGQTTYGNPFPKPFPQFYPNPAGVGYGNRYDGNQQGYEMWPGNYEKPYRNYGAGYGDGFQMDPFKNQGCGATTVIENEGYKANAVTMPSSMDDPFGEIVPSAFPAGTEPNLIQSFNRIDRNGDGVIDDRELQSVLSSCDQVFELRTVHLLMYMFTGSNRRMIGPREFVPLYKNLQTWKAVFQRADTNRNGKIDAGELRSALLSIGFSVPPQVLNLLISKFNKSKQTYAIGFDNFIECCLTVKGLTERFKAREDPCTGTATFTYNEFLLTVLPFIIA